MSKHSSLINQEFIYEIEDALTPQCHASTIASSGSALVCAWFGGTEEKNKDVGIWVSRKTDKDWGKPVEVVNGVQTDGTRYPCWNPVLFQPEEGPLFLFYKVGPNPREWWGLYVTSEDEGETWSSPVRLPEGIYGPIKNKSVQLSNGHILSPTSTEHDGWKVQIERSSNLAMTWTSSGDLNDGKEFGAIQPAILIHPNEKLQINGKWSHRIAPNVTSTLNAIAFEQESTSRIQSTLEGTSTVFRGDWEVAWRISQALSIVGRFGYRFRNNQNPEFERRPVDPNDPAGDTELVFVGYEDIEADSWDLVFGARYRFGL